MSSASDPSKRIPKSLGTDTQLIGQYSLTDLLVAGMPGVIVILITQVVLSKSLRVAGLPVTTLTIPVAVLAIGVGALFVFEGRLLAVQNAAQSDERSIYLDESGRIRDYSPAAAADLPELERSVGKRLETVLPDVATLVENDEQILARETAGEKRYYLISISTVTLSDSGVRILTLSDVTETERQRRQLLQRERELAESNELYRAVIAASFAFVFRIDFDGTLTYLSPSVEDFLGYTPEELETQSITNVIPETEAIELAWQRLEQVSKGESAQLRDFPLETTDGQTFYGDIRSVPIYEADVPPEERTSEDIVGVQGMVRDASERRQLEGLVSVINRVLRHNVRNEMTIISGYAEMLKSDLDGDAASKARRWPAGRARWPSSPLSPLPLPPPPRQPASAVVPRAAAPVRRTFRRSMVGSAAADLCLSLLTIIENHVDGTL